MKKVFLYTIIFFLFSFSQTSFGQPGKHNISFAGGLCYPYNPKPYNSVALNSGLEYLYMVNQANGIAIQFDLMRFNNKEKLLFTEFRTMSAGFRHQFNKAFYMQASLGGSSSISSFGGENFSGIAELRTGFYFLIENNLGIDLSLLLKQTTKEFGWFGIRMAPTLPLRKKKK